MKTEDDVVIRIVVNLIRNNKVFDLLPYLQKSRHSVLEAAIIEVFKSSHSSDLDPFNFDNFSIFDLAVCLFDSGTILWLFDNKLPTEDLRSPSFNKAIWTRFLTDIFEHVLLQRYRTKGGYHCTALKELGSILNEKFPLSSIPDFEAMVNQTLDSLSFRSTSNENIPSELSVAERDWLILARNNAIVEILEFTPDKLRYEFHCPLVLSEKSTTAESTDSSSVSPDRLTDSPHLRSDASTSQADQNFFFAPTSTVAAYAPLFQDSQDAVKPELNSFIFPSNQDVQNLNVDNFHDTHAKVILFLEMCSQQLQYYREKISMFYADFPRPHPNASINDRIKQFHDSKTMCLSHCDEAQITLAFFHSKVINYFERVAQLFLGFKTNEDLSSLRSSREIFVKYPDIVAQECQNLASLFDCISSGFQQVKNIAMLFYIRSRASFDDDQELDFSVNNDYQENEFSVSISTSSKKILELSCFLTLLIAKCNALIGSKLGHNQVDGANILHSSLKRREENTGKNADGDLEHKNKKPNSEPLKTPPNDSLSQSNYPEGYSYQSSSPYVGSSTHVICTGLTEGNATTTITTNSTCPPPSSTVEVPVVDSAIASSSTPSSITPGASSLTTTYTAITSSRSSTIPEGFHPAKTPSP